MGSHPALHCLAAHAPSSGMGQPPGQLWPWMVTRGLRSWRGERRHPRPATGLTLEASWWRATAMWAKVTRLDTVAAQDRQSPPWQPWQLAAVASRGVRQTYVPGCLAELCDGATPLLCPCVRADIPQEGLSTHLSQQFQSVGAAVGEATQPGTSAPVGATAQSSQLVFRLLPGWSLGPQTCWRAPCPAQIQP